MMVGIDIGTHAIKAVLLSEGPQGYVLEDYAIETTPRGAVVDREIQDVEAVGKVIAKIHKNLDSGVSLAAAAVSGQTVIAKTIYMDATLNDDELASQIELEADSLIPFPLDEVSLDFESLGINESDPSKVNVLLSAARTESIDARVAALAYGEFETKVIDIESYALSRTSELYLPSLPADAADKTIANIDIGANMTLFAVSNSGKHVYSKCQLFGGEQYTRSIVSYYNQTFEEAELAKVESNLPPNYRFEVLAPYHTILVQQIRRAIQMFLTSSGYDKVDYLVLTGGTSLVEGIQDLLTDELGIHTIVANPFEQMEVGAKLDAEKIKSIAPQLMVASGLALRSFTPWHI